MRNNLVLIGYRGTGKTTVARALAARLGWTAIDADVELESRVGQTIRELFQSEGEPVFRDWESRVLVDLVGRERTVIAAGGGVVGRVENRRVLAEAGRVVWLRARVETILDRLATDPTTGQRRPQLTTQGGADEVRQLLIERTPLYQQAANITVETDDRPIDAIVAEIMAQLPEAWRGS